ncbi:MAG: leucine-rich repeat domain-containing protein, partial [Candidatus Poribacteria bacterium]|nr:leucine-rich repeat domain-containing protein [Candidatus Poribacteria bacterium]
MTRFTYTDTQLSCHNLGSAFVVNLILTACILFFALHRPATAQTVHIPDLGLRAVIEAALGKEAGADITQSEMAKLESLQANRCRFLTLSEKGWWTAVAERWICESTDDPFGSSIKDLTGLEFAINLIELELGRNQISDVTPLKDLINLTRLSLGINRISDITPLKNLTNLTHLSLINNQISNVSPLKNLTKLVELDLLRNRVSDVFPLKDLTALTHLSLRDNQISDVSALKDLPALTYLSLRDNQISDVSALKDLTNLKYLNIFNNRISDVTSLKNMTNLKHLDLDDNQISDVSALKDLTNLIHLDISDNPILDLTPLKDMKKLTGLDLDSNGILDISSLKYLTNLSTLDLAHNEISDLSALKALVKLRRLELEDNTISDVSSLGGLINLTELILEDNAISDVSALSGLVNLTVLDLSNNHILDFSPINELVDNLIAYDFSNQTEPPANAGSEVPFISADVNRDGVVDVSDLVSVTENFHNPDLEALATTNIYPDVNNDGVVDLIDLLTVAVEMGSGAGAPSLSQSAVESSRLTAAKLNQWIRLAKQFDVEIPNLQKGISILEQLLVLLDSGEQLPEATALLSNYPNPFNPETWIPYELSKPAQVNILIHAVNGKLIRRLELGQLPAGMYRSKSRAAYWDGRNEFGESVASGVYF